MNNGLENAKNIYDMSDIPKEQQQGQIPPQATDVEQSVLGGMLIEEEAALVAFELLQKEDFYKPAHQHIFEAINSLFMDDKSFDILSVGSWLKNKQLMDVCGGSGYLAELTRSVSSAANVAYHAQIIIEKSLRRKLILRCGDVINESYRSDNDTYDVLDSAEHCIFEINDTKATKKATHINEYLDKYLSDVSEVMENPDSRSGIMTGLDIDNIIPGYKPANLAIIAARPSMGKTALLLTIARNMAEGRGIQKRNVGIFSMEMSTKELVGRLINMESHVSGQKAEMGEISKEQFNNMMDASGRLINMNIFVDDTAGLSLIDLRSKTRKMIKKHGVEIIFVDFLQLMSYSGTASNRHDEITAISRGLKLIAKTYDIPVIALSQLSRAVETRGGDKRPILSDLRESGSIEENADIVQFLYRPEYYDIKTTPEGQSTSGLAEVMVAKQRNGPTGTIPLRFIKQFAVFENGIYQHKQPRTDNTIEDQSPF